MQGEGTYGQLGNGDVYDVGDDEPVSSGYVLPLLKCVTDMVASSGGTNMYALYDDGSVQACEY